MRSNTSVTTADVATAVIAAIVARRAMRLGAEAETSNTMMNANTNCRKRPNLADQINRLDNMLDGLSEGLNEAVADAVKAAVGAAVKEAVQAVLTEVLANPDLRATLSFPGPALPSEATPTAPAATNVERRPSSWWDRARAAIGAVRSFCAQSIQRVGSASARLWQRTVTGLTVGREVVRHFKYQILIAIGLGMLVGLGAWCAGPWLSAMMGGAAGLVTALAVKAERCLQKTFAMFVATFA